MGYSGGSDGGSGNGVHDITVGEDVCEFTPVCSNKASRVMFLRHMRDILVCERCTRVARNMVEFDTVMEVSSNEFYLS